MTTSKIPVDIRNPAQVFACLGIMELADRTLDEVQGRFGWLHASTPPGAAIPDAFELEAKSDADPIRSVLELLRTAKVGTPNCLVPHVCGNPQVWPSPEMDEKTAPVRLEFGDCEAVSSFVLSAWSDRSSRGRVKLFAGPQKGMTIIRDLFEGTGKDVGAKHLLDQVLQKRDLDPFRPLVPTRGSFRIEPRGVWTAIGAGYSIDVENMNVSTTNPLAEVLAMVGFEHARYAKRDRTCVYSVWMEWASLELARALIGAVPSPFHTITLAFEEEGAGKYKNFTFARAI